jgi:hypothetical protein
LEDIVAAPVKKSELFLFDIAILNPCMVLNLRYQIFGNLTQTCFELASELLVTVADTMQFGKLQEYFILYLIKVKDFLCYLRDFMERFVRYRFQNHTNTQR